MIVLAAFASIASSEENEPTAVDDDGNPSASESEGGQETFSIGQNVQLGDWQVVVHGVTDPFESTNEFVTPSEGQRWVAVDVEVTNNSDEPASLSSLLCFEITDAENRSYDVTITAEDTASSPDGEVDPGGARRGTITYEVPLDAGGLQLRFKCDLFSSGTAIIDLSDDAGDVPGEGEAPAESEAPAEGAPADDPAAG